ncbi:hypothetical protein JHK87_022654 [Glycine soja]|nr:hypothetical protein JHK87_022654 [Glycine soja]
MRGRKHTVVTAETIKGRLLMEMNYMLAYGSGKASLRLLWNSGSLDILLPFECLFSKLDKLLAPNRPCHIMMFSCIGNMKLETNDLEWRLDDSFIDWWKWQLVRWQSHLQLTDPLCFSLSSGRTG